MPVVKALISLEGGAIHLEGTQEFVEKYLAQAAPAGQIQQSIIVTGEHSEESEKILIKEGLDHAWNWFSLHAGQRMQCVNFFLVGAAFLSSAYVTALRFDQPLAAAGVGILGFLLSICFSRFEVRIRELVKAGEAALGPIQEHLVKITSIAELNLIGRVETPKNWFTKYSTVIPTLHWLTALAFLLGAFYAYQVSITKGLSPSWQGFPVALVYRVTILIAAIVSMHYGYRLLTHQTPESARISQGVILLCGLALTLGGIAIVALSLYLSVS